MIKYNTYYKDINNTRINDFLNEIEANINSFKESSNYHVKYRESYIVKSHKLSQTDIREGYVAAKKITPFRKEEWICKLALGKCFDEVGEIVDFQIPLKVPGCSKAENDGRGKIDLLSYNEATNTAYLLEAKVDTSTESPLKAIMECYTYWQQIGGSKADDFLLRSLIGKKATLKKAIIIFESKEKRYLYQKLEQNKDRLKKLMAELDVECFVAETSTDANIIEKLRKYI